MSRETRLIEVVNEPKTEEEYKEMIGK